MLTRWKVLWLRIRVTIAHYLLKGSGCEVARTVFIERAAEDTYKLRSYFKTSGGLNQPMIPRRLRAYRIAMRATESLHASIRGIGLPAADVSFARSESAVLPPALERKIAVAP